METPSPTNLVVVIGVFALLIKDLVKEILRRSKENTTTFCSSCSEKNEVAQIKEKLVESRFKDVEDDLKILNKYIKPRVHWIINSLYQLSAKVGLPLESLKADD